MSAHRGQRVDRLLESVCDLRQDVQRLEVVGDSSASPLAARRSASSDSCSSVMTRSTAIRNCWTSSRVPLRRMSRAISRHLTYSCALSAVNFASGSSVSTAGAPDSWSWSSVMQKGCILESVGDIIGAGKQVPNGFRVGHVPLPLGVHGSRCHPPSFPNAWRAGGQRRDVLSARVARAFEASAS